MIFLLAYPQSATSITLLRQIRMLAHKHKPIYELPFAQLLAANAYIVNNLRNGKILRRKSSYGSPLFFVRHGNKLCAVFHCRALNRIKKRNNAPLPRPDEMFDRLGDSQYFSKMDLKVGFHQSRVQSEDIERLEFKTKFGHLGFLFIPMGLCNSLETFQSLMNRIFNDCIDIFLVIYMGDLLILSKTKEDHMKHL